MSTLKIALISLIVCLAVLFARDALIAWEIHEAERQLAAAQRAQRIARRAEQLWQSNYYARLNSRPMHWFWNPDVGQWAYGPVQHVSEAEIERDHDAQMPYYLRLAATQEP